MLYTNVIKTFTHNVPHTYNNKQRDYHKFKLHTKGCRYDYSYVVNLPTEGGGGPGGGGGAMEFGGGGPGGGGGGAGADVAIASWYTVASYNNDIQLHGIQCTVYFSEISITFTP